MSNRYVLREVISWFFGIVFLTIGLINTFWGNDAGYGIFIALLSFAFIPPATALFKKVSGRPIPSILKILLGTFIIWSALGVGELFDKIDLVLMNL
jgi:hypothetical protein